MSKWEVVMGLEVHAELSTKTKIFCGCSTVFGGKPNTNVCPICTGMPGTLPVLNRAVLDYALKLGVTLGCNINQNCKFDRKNYFYPDLPKAYQVSQLYAPICQGGGLEIEVGESGEKKFINIHQIHMEEDAGKLVHESNFTQIDYNRGCVPLLEIVSKPDFRSGDEVIAYLEKLRETLMYLDVCDCKMQEGSLRADVNLSVRKLGGELGTRTEMKNLNSFKAIARAIVYESERQIDLLESGGEVKQETRRWDDERGESYAMRSKANAQDYRYFPDPDLLPISITDEELELIRKSLPELAHQKRERYMKDYGMSKIVACTITSHKNLSDLFEITTEHSEQGGEVANLISGEFMRLLKSSNTLPEKIEPEILGRKFAELVKLVVDSKINRGAYKEVVGKVFESPHEIEPMAYIEEKGLLMITDTGAVEEAVKSILAKNQSAVDDYRAGKQKAFGFLMGQTMKKLGGTASPDVIKSTLTDVLKG
ncbi:MAG: Asp-tRNA(Asn)/Glu-tRNA(Gln) amidotransferase subunit GatB [Oscillospiraceae bacterium]|nr:Asp-tRNA(Asn)/Glu-tRNA(Gln) amidotransferase subunit GatB [Oscillospiraceae bacterium]